tara:strand:+ start:331 stop:1026 length:696 start_codon:yes stop_codon:yes gene_type:complete
MNKYMLLKNGKIMVNLGASKEDKGLFKARQRGEADNNYILLNQDEIEAFNNDINLLRSTKHKSLSYNDIQKNIFVFQKSSIRELLISDESSSSDSSNLENLFYKSKVVFFNNRFKFYIPSDIDDLLSMKTPLNQPKYLIKNIQFNDILTHNKSEIATATLIVIDDNLKQVSLSGNCNIKNFSNIDILDNIMFRNGYEKVSSSFFNTSECDFLTKDSFIFQQTYKKLPTDNF